MPSSVCLNRRSEMYKDIFDSANKAIERAAKLTTKQRKKMKSSTFCGPGRSFPVNDCAHYTAALRLLNRSKFSSSTKAKIRSCVNAKGKKMGCGGAKKKEKSFYLTKEIQAMCELPIWQPTMELIEKAKQNPGMDLEWEDV